MRRYRTDVLVIGGGGAATASTIAAHDNGARTMLAVKGRFGVAGVRGAGATSNPIGDYWTIRTVGPDGGLFNPPNAVHADMVQAGLGMADPELCRIFVDEVPEAIKRLKGMGMRFKSKMIATMDGRRNDQGTNNIVAIQKAVIQQTGTEVVEGANIIDLIVENGHCIGAVGVHDDGEAFAIEAGAVVLATGGVGQLFRHSFNPPGNTGDGYAMAMRAGADLFNMEFMQQGLATTWPTQAMIMLYEMEEPYRLVNAKGRFFVQDYLPSGVTLKEVSDLKAMHWPVSCRDAAIHLDRAIKQETLKGNATGEHGIFLDFASADRGFEPELFVEFMTANGIDVRRDLIQVQMHHHTSNGGVRINARAETPSIEGLFAVGEVAGWQGADRLGGTMLGGSQVFGWRAGKYAAERAKALEPTADEAEIERLLEPLKRLGQPSAGGIGSRPADVLPKLQHVMWDALIVEKDETSLARARDALAVHRDWFENGAAIAEPMDLALAMELRNLNDVGEAIVEAASMRTESRGAHVRSDFPERDDANWLANIFATHSEGKVDLRKDWVSAATGWEDHPGDIRIKPWG
ncbi:MAG: FAD-binding protein [Pseudomonadota bacterium]